MVRVARVALLCVITGSAPRAQTQDQSPPGLVGFAFAPSTVDTTTGPATVTITLHVTDDLSGFAGGEVLFRSPSGRYSLKGIVDAAPVAGSITDGIYRVFLSVPQFEEPGAWRVDHVGLSDAARNSVSLLTQTLDADGFPTLLEIVSVPDTTPPGVAGFTFTPATVDVSLAPATVTVDLHLVDDLSGILAGVAVFRSPSGRPLEAVVDSPYAGTINGGCYRGTNTIPALTEFRTGDTEAVLKGRTTEDDRPIGGTDSVRIVPGASRPRPRR